MNELSTIKIPQTVYVGFQGRRAVDEVPLGFMTPYDETKAGQKRQQTVDQWAKGWGSNKTFNSVTLENVPMIGFKIGRAIRRSRSWGGNASYVRIEDPRGFELEISIENMVMVMDQNIVEDGEIMQECVWGRDGGKNILLPTNSEPYQASLNTTKRLNAVLSLKDVKPGSKVKLVTGETGIYYGSLYPIFIKHEAEHTDTRSGYRHERNTTEVYTPEIRGTKRYILYTSKGKKGTFNVYASIKVAEVLEEAKEKLKPQDVEKLIATKIAEGNNKFVNHVSSTSYYDRFVGLAADQTLDYAIVQKDIAEDYAKTLKHNRYGTTYASRSIYMESADGQIYTASNGYMDFTTNFLQAKNTPRKYANIMLCPNPGSYWSRHDAEIEVQGGFIGIKADLTEEKVTEYKFHQQQWHVTDEELKRLFVLDVVIKLKSGEQYVYDFGRQDTDD